MKIFVNNVDGHMAGAICADLRKLGSHIIGTRKGANLELVPPVVKKVVPRIEVRRLLKTIAACDVVVYDLHDADLEELELVIRILSTSELSQDITFILISSVGVWARTQREYESTEEPSSTEDAWASEAGEEAAGSGGEVEAAEEAADAAEGEAADGGEKDESAAKEPQDPRPPRPKALKSEDYTRRKPAPKFQEWRTIETLTLAMKERPRVRPYVICTGLPYGNGEEAFLGLFKAAWQTRPTLRVIGEGFNTIPLVHVRDAARLVRRVIEEKPELDYHLAVDRGDNSQREIIQAVADEFGIPYEVRSVSIAEAILAELADMLTLDLRLEPSPLMVEAHKEEPPAAADGEPPAEEEGILPERSAMASIPAALAERSPVGASLAIGGFGGAGAEGADDAAGAEAPEEPPPFRWWCEAGLVANISKVGTEFRRWRRLEPVTFCVVGPPGSCVSEVGRSLADKYNVPHVSFEDLLEEQRNLPTPLGQTLRDKIADIEAALANPKATGPYLLPPAVTAKVVEEAMTTKPFKYRGWVLSGFPQSLEEATEFFMEDAPMPASPEGAAPAPEADPKKGGKGKKEEVPQVEKVLKPGFKLDSVAIVAAPDEACMERMKAGDKPEDQWMPMFKKKLERYQKEFADAATCPVAELFTTKIGVTPMVIQEPPPQAPAAEGGEAIPAGETSAEGEAAKVGSCADVVEAAVAQICAQVEAAREVNNFLAPPGAPCLEAKESKVVEESAAVDEEVLRRREEELRKAKEAEERLEHIRKEEFARLEKHSEPLRQYLMSFVVPTVTSGLVEVCRSQPEDPVGYLAEYLSVYAQMSRKRSNAIRRLSMNSAT